jgi:hypothetical protein
MDVLSEPQLEFGTWNPRALNTAEGNKLFKSFMDEGIQRFTIENAISVFVQRDWIDVTRLSQQGGGGEDWPMVVWTSTGEDIKTVKSAGGRHRLYALRKLRMKMEKEIGELEKRKDGRKKEDDVKKREKDLDTRREACRKAGYWLVAFYDQGKTRILKAETGTDIRAEKALANEGSVARFLSRNQAKHIFGETAGEKFVAMLQKILDAEEEGEEQKKKAYERVALEATKTASKLSGIFQNEATVDLYLRFMRLQGPILNQMT